MPYLARVQLISNDETLIQLLGNYLKSECGCAFEAVRTPSGKADATLFDVADGASKEAASAWLATNPGLALTRTGLDIAPPVRHISMPVSLKDLARQLQEYRAPVALPKGRTWDAARRVIIGDDEVALTEKEAALFDMLLEANGPVSREALMNKVWSYAENADSHTLETHMYRLRGKLRAAGLEDYVINTDEGYVWKPSN